MTNNASEVARIRQQIEEEYQAARQAMYGFSEGSTRHRYITARMENMGRYQAELSKHIGEREAVEVLNDVMTRSTQPSATESGNVEYLEGTNDQS